MDNNCAVNKFNVETCFFLRIRRCSPRWISRSRMFIRYVCNMIMSRSNRQDCQVDLQQTLVHQTKKS